ncbi:MAG: DHH family phosphoesterase [Anaerovoracaceae bacterium]
MDEKRLLIKRWFSIRKLDILAMLVLVVVIGVICPVLALPALAFVCVITGISHFIGKSKRHSVSRVVETIVGGMSDITSAAVIHSPYPLCLIDEKGQILWSNTRFRDMFTEISEIPDDIFELTGVKLQKLTNEELKDRNILITAINRSFRVQYSEAGLRESTSEGQNQASGSESSGQDSSSDTAGSATGNRTPDTGKSGSGSSDASGERPPQKTVRMLHWMETTASVNLKKTYRDERLCIAHIIVDNLDDILAQASDEKKSSLAGDIEKELRQWAVRFQGALVRSTKSRFTMLCDSRNLENITANKFQILDDIRAIDTGVDIPASLSIGIGAQGKSITQIDEFAAVALDLAQGRGGDQAVVKKGSNVEYFGGKLQTVEKRNKGKSRIVALALRRLMDQAPRVYVMGHKLPDMDSLGAALGVARMAMNRGKNVNIVIDSWDAVNMLYNLALEENPELFVSSDTAKQTISRDDLLVVVDTSKPSVAECGVLTGMADKVVVIDHHRRGEEMIQNPTLVHIEPYASSTSELVTEMIQYVSSEKKDLTRVEAEGLLAGIAVDTKNFSVKTGVRTFEAAAWLRRQGADTTIVRQFFQTDMELFQKKAQIISRAVLLQSDVALSFCEGMQKNISVLISMAADELLNIRGMKATFVVGQNDDGSLRVSARSLGEVNVQLIMEKLGGGGNLTTAGARLENTALKEGVELVKQAIAEGLAEQSEKARKQQEKQQAKEAKASRENAENNGNQAGREAAESNGNQSSRRKTGS